MTEDELRDLRTTLRAELAPLRTQLDAAFSDFARAIATEINGVKTENATLKARLASIGQIVAAGPPERD